MTKEVLVTISGLQFSPETDNESVELITSGSYYKKNGKHYIIYDEVVEGVPGVIKNKIRITEGEKIEIMKNGVTNTHMIFEKDKINLTEYQTPYGEMLIGTQTNRMDVTVEESRIGVEVAYALDINQEKVADCNIVINIKALEK